jgi:uncharacterized protein YndB with AHSA1/START domain
MSDAQFRLTTQWRFDASIDAVWQVLSRTAEWPQWWPAVIEVQELASGDALGIGAYRRMTWRTALPYTLSFNMRTTRVERLTLIEGQSEGELAGIGRWQLSEADGRTLVQYDWIVNVTKPWMRGLLPVLRPVFAWNHRVVMEWGQRGLEKQLRKFEYQRDALNSLSA